MTTNRYPGICTACGTAVDAHAGVLDGRTVYCSEPISGAGEYQIDGETVLVRTYACDRYRRREAREMVAARRAPRPEVTAEQRERAAHWAAKEAEWAAQGMRSCGRCGGAGGSQAWPGYVCYGCQGKGCIPA